MNPYLSNEVHALNDLSEDDVLSIEPRGLGGAEEKLRAVGVWSSIGHGENT